MFMVVLIKFVKESICMFVEERKFRYWSSERSKFNILIYVESLAYKVWINASNKLPNRERDGNLLWNTLILAYYMKVNTTNVCWSVK